MSTRAYAVLTVSAALAALALPALPLRAEAADPGAQVSPGEPAAAASQPPSADGEETRWYGWQLMLSDAAAIGAGYASGRLESAPLAGLSGALYLGAAPAIHGFHHQSGSALRSALLRVGIPVAAGLIVHATENPNAELYGLGYVAGGVLGSGLAMVIDWCTATERVPATGPTGDTTPLALPAAQPGDWGAAVVPTRDGARLALTVAF